MTEPDTDATEWEPCRMCGMWIPLGDCLCGACQALEQGI